jgi:conjugal transfer pilus assembly protein TraK
MKRNSLLTLLAVIGVFPLTANAIQVIEPANGESTIVKISAKEMTRIAVDGGRIKSFKVVDDDATVEEDKTNGQVFVIPKTTKPVNAFVITATGNTYGLVMEQADIPLETVMIREKFSATMARPTSGKSGGLPDGLEQGALDKAIQRLLTLMATGGQSPSFEKIDKPAEFSLWAGTRFVRVAQYKGRALSGDYFQLTNLTKTPMRLAEQEFYKDDVIAVAVEHQVLANGETTNIFIVRAAEND